MLAANLVLRRARGGLNWPVDRERYDRSPVLRPSESAQLKQLITRSDRGATTWPGGACHTLDRLVQPVHDALDFTAARDWTRTGVVTLLMREMHDRETSFWAWGHEEWLAILTPDSPLEQAFRSPG